MSSQVSFLCNCCLSLCNLLSFSQRQETLHPVGCSSLGWHIHKYAHIHTEGQFGVAHLPVAETMSWDCWRKLEWRGKGDMKPRPSCCEATVLGRAPHRWFNPHSRCDSGHHVTQHSPGILKWFTQTGVIPMTPETPPSLQAFIKGKLTSTY